MIRLARLVDKRFCGDRAAHDVEVAAMLLAVVQQRRVNDRVGFNADHTARIVCDIGEHTSSGPRTAPEFDDTI